MRGHRARGGETDRHAGREPDRGEDRGLPHHEADDVGAAGAEGETRAELARAAAHAVRHHAVNADGREHQRDERESAEQSHRQPRDRRR